MKKLVYILFVCLFVATGFASYTYVIDTYQTLPDLTGTQSMLITGMGGGNYTYLSDNSSITVESTSTLGQGTGGVWEIEISYNSSLYMFGGQVNMVDIGNNATAFLSGGLIQQIWSYQIAKIWDNDNQVWIPTPHITIVYSGDLPTIQNINGYDVLVGTWGNGDPFSIYLSEVPHNTYGYSPAIENIRFELVPEPMTLALLGLGGLGLRKRRKL